MEKPRKSRKGTPPAAGRLLPLYLSPRLLLPLALLTLSDPCIASQEGVFWETYPPAESGEIVWEKTWSQGEEEPEEQPCGGEKSVFLRSWMLAGVLATAIALVFLLKKPAAPPQPLPATIRPPARTPALSPATRPPARTPAPPPAPRYPLEHSLPQDGQTFQGLREHLLSSENLDDITQPLYRKSYSSFTSEEQARLLEAWQHHLAHPSSR